MPRILPLLLGLVSLPLALAQSPTYGDLSCTGEGQGSGFQSNIDHVSHWSRTTTGEIDTRFEASQSVYDELLTKIRTWSDGHKSYTGTSAVARLNSLGKDLNNLGRSGSRNETATSGTQMLPALPESLRAELRAVLTKDYLAARYGDGWERSASHSPFDPQRERWYRTAMAPSNSSASPSADTPTADQIEDLTVEVEGIFAAAKAYYEAKPVRQGRKGPYVVISRNDRQWTGFRQDLRAKLVSLRQASRNLHQAELNAHQGELGDALRRAFASDTASGGNLYSLPPTILGQIDTLRRMAMVSGSTQRAEDQFEEGKDDGYDDGFSDGEDSVSCSES